MEEGAREVSADPIGGCSPIDGPVEEILHGGAAEADSCGGGVGDVGGGEVPASSPSAASAPVFHDGEADAVVEPASGREETSCDDGGAAAEQREVGSVSFKESTDALVEPDPAGGDGLIGAAEELFAGSKEEGILRPGALAGDDGSGSGIYCIAPDGDGGLPFIEPEPVPVLADGEVLRGVSQGTAEKPLAGFVELESEQLAAVGDESGLAEDITDTYMFDSSEVELEPLVGAIVDMDLPFSDTEFEEQVDNPEHLEEKAALLEEEQKLPIGAAIDEGDTLVGDVANAIEGGDLDVADVGSEEIAAAAEHPYPLLGSSNDERDRFMDPSMEEDVVPPSWFGDLLVGPSISEGVSLAAASVKEEADIPLSSAMMVGGVPLADMVGKEYASITDNEPESLVGTTNGDCGFILEDEDASLSGEKHHPGEKAVVLEDPEHLLHTDVDVEDAFAGSSMEVYAVERNEEYIAADVDRGGMPLIDNAMGDDGVSVDAFEEGEGLPFEGATMFAKEESLLNDTVANDESTVDASHGEAEELTLEGPPMRAEKESLMNDEEEGRQEFLLNNNVDNNEVQMDASNVEGEELTFECAPMPMEEKSLMNDENEGKNEALAEDALEAVDPMVDVVAEEAETYDGINRRGGGRKKRGHPPKTRVAKAATKREVEEDVCFICFDGGNLVVCDRRGCPKVYHASCVNRDESFFRSKGRWNCGWHICSVCEKTANFMCYTCTYSLCKACIKDAKFVCVRGNKGLCETCLGTVMLIEMNGQDNKKAPGVDFDDKTCWEYLFKEYWVDLKRKLSLTLEEVTKAKTPRRETNVPVGDVESSDELYGANDVASDSSSGNRQEHRASTSKRKQRKRAREVAVEERPVKSAIVVAKDSSIAEDVDWASNELLQFVMHMREGDGSVLSQFDVQALLLEYIKQNNLRDPRRKSQIICDARLQNLFGKPRVGHFEMLKLLESHFLIKEVSHPVTDDSQGGVVDPDSSPTDADGNSDASTKKRKTRRRDEREPQTNLDDYAAIDVHNITLMYLRRNLLEELIDDSVGLEEKIVGSFVRIRISGATQKQDMYRLVQVAGTRKAAERYKIGKKMADIVLEILNLGKIEAITIDIISNQDFTEEECKRLRQSIKCGLLGRLTVGDVQEKARALQFVRVNDWMESEKLRLSHLRDRASEQGRRKELRECVEKLQLLNTPGERMRRLNEVSEIHSDPHMDPDYESADDEAHNDKKKENILSRKANDAGSRSSNWSGGSARKSEHTNRDSSRSLPHEDSPSGLSAKKSEFLWDQGKNATIPMSAQPNMESETPSAAAAVQPIINEADKIWHYQDPSGKVQGPFSMTQLKKWSAIGYFPANLRIWKASEKQEDSILLNDALAGKFLRVIPPSEPQGNTPHATTGTGVGDDWAAKIGNNVPTRQSFAPSNAVISASASPASGNYDAMRSGKPWSSAKAETAHPHEGRHPTQPGNTHAWSGQPQNHNSPRTSAPYTGSAQQSTPYQGRGGRGSRWQDRRNMWRPNQPGGQGHDSSSSNWNPVARNQSSERNAQQWGNDSLNLPTPTQQAGTTSWAGGVQVAPSNPIPAGAQPFFTGTHGTPTPVSVPFPGNNIIAPGGGSAVSNNLFFEKGCPSPTPTHEQTNDVRPESNAGAGNLQPGSHALVSGLTNLQGSAPLAPGSCLLGLQDIQAARANLEGDFSAWEASLSMPSPTPTDNPSGGASSAVSVSQPSTQNTIATGNAFWGTLLQGSPNPGWTNVPNVPQGLANTQQAAAAAAAAANVAWGIPAQGGNTSVNAAAVWAAAQAQPNANANVGWSSASPSVQGNANVGMAWAALAPGSMNLNPGLVQVATQSVVPPAAAHGGFVNDQQVWGAQTSGTSNQSGGGGWGGGNVNANQPVQNSGWAAAASASMSSVNPGVANPVEQTQAAAGQGNSWNGWQGENEGGHSGWRDSGGSGHGGGRQQFWNRMQSSGGGGGTDGNPGGPRQGVCRFHENGHCLKGSRCNYFHS